MCLFKTLQLPMGNKIHINNKQYHVLKGKTTSITAQRSGLAHWTSDPKVVGLNPIVVDSIEFLWTISVNNDMDFHYH